MGVRWLGVVVAGALTFCSAFAQAECYDPRQQLPATMVSAFVASPAELLQQFPEGGLRMISQVRDLTASSAATLPLILSLIANANSQQRAAIGAGLAQAARICVRSEQAFATQIQQAIAASGDQELIVAFTSVLGDLPIGAAGGGGGGGGGGTGGGGPTSAAGLTFGGSNVGSTGPSGALNYRTNSGNLLTGGGTGGTTALAAGVSPF